MQDLASQVVFAEITQSSLRTLQLLSQEVLFPLIKNPENRQVRRAISCVTGPSCLGF